MNTYGETIKRIRKSKGLSQEYIAHNIISRSNLSKIENNYSIPSILTLIAITDALDVSLDEFEFIKNGYRLGQKKVIIHDFFSIASTNNRDKMKKLIKKCNDYLALQDNMIIQDIKDILLQILNLRTNPDASEHVSALILQRLENIEQFSLIEIKLVCHLLYVFPNDAIKQLTPQLLEMIERYTLFDPTLNILKISLLINISFLLFDETCITHLNEALKSAKAAQRYDLVATIYYVKGAITNNQSLQQKAENIFTTIDQVDLFKAVQHRVYTIQQKIPVAIS